MATWQARLVSETYDLLYVEPPSTLDAFAFWTTIKELCPPITPIILGGTHAQLAPFLSENLVRRLNVALTQPGTNGAQFQYRYSWTLVSTSTPKDSGRRCPHVRTRVLHLFCAQYVFHLPTALPRLIFS